VHQQAQEDGHSLITSITPYHTRGCLHQVVVGSGGCTNSVHCVVTQAWKSTACMRGTARSCERSAIASSTSLLVPQLSSTWRLHGQAITAQDSVKNTQAALHGQVQMENPDVLTQYLMAVPEMVLPRQQLRLSKHEPPSAHLKHTIATARRATGSRESIPMMRSQSSRTSSTCRQQHGSKTSSAHAVLLMRGMDLGADPIRGSASRAAATACHHSLYNTSCQ
jgi:hypothetical protein